MKYKHTQIGWVMIMSNLMLGAAFIKIHLDVRAEPPSVDAGTNFAITFIMMAILVIVASFSSLEVIVDEEYVRIKFGYGLYKKKFARREIESVRVVRNPWYFGWGIRQWLWPKMWIYNVSGLDAIEIKMKNGNIYRIGTDEPQRLEQAILETQR